MKLMTKLLAAGTLVAATQANAITLDFTSPAWAAANNQTSFGIAPVTAAAGPAGSKLYQDSVDGLGVLGHQEPDEIDQEEFLTITFDFDVLLNSISISDLFNVAGDGTPGGELGFLSLWLDGAELLGSPLNLLGSLSEPTNGEQTIMVGDLKVDSIKFYTAAANDDFSVAGLEYFLPRDETSLPEPSLAVLLGIGLMGLGLSRRRLAKKA